MGDEFTQRDQELVELCDRISRRWEHLKREQGYEQEVWRLRLQVKHLEEHIERTERGCVRCGTLKRGSHHWDDDELKLCHGCRRSITGEITDEMVLKWFTQHDLRLPKPVEHLLTKREEKMELKVRDRHAPEREQIVYFARLGQRVKIGISVNPEHRIGSFAGATLIATEPGGRDREQELHREFKDLRRHGEWFELAAPLTGYVRALAAFVGWAEAQHGAVEAA